MADRAPHRRLRVVNARRRSQLGATVVWGLLGLVGLTVAAVVGGGLFFLGLYARAAGTLPAVPPFETLRAGRGTVVTAHDGCVIGEFLGEEQRLELDFDRIPAGLILAVLAAEDERFFEHSGLDLRGIARAIFVNLREGAFVEGASTITQQLAKSVLGRPEAFGKDAELSLTQKLREAIYARRLEDVYTKEQILLLYLNRIYLGHHAYGVRAAARNYFRKDLRELTLTEMALLAGLPQAPSALNPLRNPDRARKRLEHVLDQMARNGFIAEAARNAAVVAPLLVFPLDDPFGDGAPYFTRAVARELRRRFGTPEAPDRWKRQGLRVETTADLSWHRAAEERLAEGLRQLDKKQGYRGPLLRLAPEDQASFFGRVAAELRGRSPGEGTVWPALVEAVDAEGLDARLTSDGESGSGVAGRLPLANMRWAGPYEEEPKVSFGRKLKDPREVFAPGDVILVRVEKPDAGRWTFALEQEPRVEGAVVAIDPHTGYTRVLHGGYDFDRSEVNRVYSVRQTGSAIKPAVYSLAYDLGLTPSTLLSGAPFRDGDYAPTGTKGRGDLIVWDALATSENNVSLRVMNYVQNRGGANRLQAWVRALGLDQPMAGYTAEVLGVDQTPAGMTRMMATFARRGRQREAVLVRRVVDGEGRVLVRPPSFRDPMNGPVDVIDALHRELAAPPEVAIPTETAYLTAANLREVFRRGTARREGRSLVVPACGKTGSLAYDVWFTGFTGDTAATVWVGADRRERILGAGRKKSQVYGGNTALPIWRDFLNDVLAGRPKTDPVGEPPPEVVVVTVDPATGWLATGKGRRVPHRKGTEPVAVAPPAVEGSDAELLQSDF